MPIAGSQPSSRVSGAASRMGQANASADADIGGAERDLITQIRRYMPLEGRNWSEVRSELIKHKAEDYDWRGGRIPIYVYHDNDELLSVAREAYNLYFSENALGKRAFPSLAHMEQEVIATSLSLFHAPEGAKGSFTSGGTESIFLAMKSARDHFRIAKSRDLHPNIVIPRTAHPAFDKAGHYLDVEVRRVGIASDFRVAVTQLQDAVGNDTMMIVGSAPCYPYGVFDPIGELAEIAQDKGLWLHVDACLGGFLSPFARDEGYPIPDFDFSIPGVSSLSADLHKYGFCAKGASVVLYRSAEQQAHQGFHFENWPRGTYSTETFLGTRPGGSIASAWAVTQYLGRSGYRRLARKILDTKDRLIKGIESVGGLEVLRPSELCILLYRSIDPKVDIKAVAEELGELGWFVGRSREPQALHLALNAVHAPIVDRYVADLRAAVDTVRLSRRIGRDDDATY